MVVLKLIENVSISCKGLYFNVNLILVLVSVILTIIVLNFHFRGPKKQRVPKWMRIYIIGYLGRLFCFCEESRAFCLVQDECFSASGFPSVIAKSDNGDKSRSWTGGGQCESQRMNMEDSLQNEDVLNVQDEEAYVRYTAPVNRKKNR